VDAVDGEKLAHESVRQELTTSSMQQQDAITGANFAALLHLRDPGSLPRCHRASQTEHDFYVGAVSVKLRALQ
jgi:hypothetical protein